MGRAVVVGGCGAVGGLFAGLLATSGREVTVVDREKCAAAPTRRSIQADITRPSEELLHDCLVYTSDADDE